MTLSALYYKILNTSLQSIEVHSVCNALLLKHHNLSYYFQSNNFFDYTYSTFQLRGVPVPCGVHVYLYANNLPIRQYDIVHQITKLDRIKTKIRDFF